MFEITQEPINIDLYKKKLCLKSAGAFSSFEGWVRNINDGKEVLRLEYDCYEALAQKTGLQIIEEVMEKFDILSAFAIHRYGLLEISETAVWLGVCSIHREEAFKACRYLIDEIKHRVPIWKKEYYISEEPIWVRCHRCSHNHEEIL